MSITNVELIRDALSLINVLAIGEAAEPEQSDHAVKKLNKLLAEWEADGVDLQYFPQSMDSLGGVCPIPANAELAVTYYLAFALAPHYGKTVSPEMLALGQQYYNRLTRDSVSELLKPVDMTHLPVGSAYPRRVDIVSG